MAFTSTITRKGIMGDKKYAYGTFTSAGGSTGGDIETGMYGIDFIQLQQKGSAVVADAPVVNETLPSGGDVTIVTTANAVGYWFAYGK